jgi:GntR family transcriptional regulator
MILNIRADSSVPVYKQIVNQVIYAVAAGGLGPGSEIPSARELAGRLVINPNTVSRAFQELERRGVVAYRRGERMAVTAEAPALCLRERQDIVRDHIRSALREAASSGLPPEEVRQLVDQELAWARGRQDNSKDHVRGKR